MSELLEKVNVGGGQTGASSTADPVGGTATLPASKKQGDAMQKGQNPAGTAIEDTDSDNNTKPTGDASGSNKASIGTKASAASASMKEDVDAMFNGEELTEEFKEKATVIFEAAVQARIDEAKVALEEEYKIKLEEEVSTIQEELATKVDEYLQYVVQEWMAENEVAIQSSLKAEITEEFIDGMKSLFAEHYIEVPDEKLDVLGEMNAEIEELKAKLNDQINESIELKSRLNEKSRDEVFAQVSEGLAATQVEKLKTLAEGVDFDSADSFKKKLELVKENYFPTEKKQSVLTEEITGVDDDSTASAAAQTSGPMAKYVTAISRTLKQ